MQATRLVFLAVLCLFALSGVAASAELDVGTGHEYNSIQAAINAANSGDVINIHEGIYSIDKSIDINKNGITLVGDGGNKTIIYTDSPEDISDSDNMAMFSLVGVHDVTVKNITFIGPATSRTNQHEHGGTGYGGLRESRNGIYVRNCEDIVIDGVYITMLYSDGVRITGSDSVQVINSNIESAGHDSVSVFKSSNVYVQNCVMDEMINTCVRLDGAESCVIDGCTFKQTLSGTGGGYIELENSISNITVSNNLFTSASDEVWYPANPEGGNVRAIHNALYGVSWGSSGPYSIAYSDNEEFDSAQDWLGLGYGATKTSIAPGKIIKFVDDGVDQKTNDNATDINEEVEGCDNCTENDNCTDSDNECTSETTEKSCSSVINNFFDSICAGFISLSSEDAETAAVLANGSAYDSNQALAYLNGSDEEKELGVAYLESSELKLKYAQEMMQVSQKNIDAAKERMNKSAGCEDICAPVGCSTNSSCVECTICEEVKEECSTCKKCSS